jgi:hypothetical protein
MHKAEQKVRWEEEAPAKVADRGFPKESDRRDDHSNPP